MLPETVKARFESTLTLSNGHQFEPKVDFDYVTYNPSAYHPQGVCLGDSGSGHWMEANNEQSVLIGISTTLGPGNVCGDLSFMQRTTDEMIITWIKEKANIK